MKANIITIGDEILIGQITDTNSAFIAAGLNKAGISVKKMISVGDVKEEIITALDETDSDVNIVILTGGLGPTGDDVTKPALAEYFDSKMVIDQNVMENVIDFLRKRNVSLSERNKKQAEVPDKCNVIPNHSGTAPGMWFEKQGKVFVSLPGVPFEMTEMFSNQVIPMLEKRFRLPAIFHFTIITTGLPESQMADRLAEWEPALPSFIKPAYLPSPGILRLRLSATGDNADLLKAAVEDQLLMLQALISDHIIGYGDETIETLMAALLKKEKTSLSVAESCTGGLISKMITSVAGSSAYYKGGVIAYSNEIKEEFLGVNKQDLIQQGAVSEAVVRQMAEGVLKRFHSAYSVATSGIAGPDGGTPEKPVGTVWIAVASEEKTVAKLFHFGDNRERNILRSSVAALNLLRLLILKKI